MDPEYAPDLNSRKPKAESDVRAAIAHLELLAIGAPHYYATARSSPAISPQAEYDSDGGRCGIPERISRAIHFAH